MCSLAWQATKLKLVQICVSASLRSSNSLTHALKSNCNIDALHIGFSVQKNSVASSEAGRKAGGGLWIDGLHKTLSSAHLILNFININFFSCVLQFGSIIPHLRIVWSGIIQTFTDNTSFPHHVWLPARQFQLLITCWNDEWEDCESAQIQSYNLQSSSFEVVTITLS